jgi:hypothetical protein
MAVIKSIERRVADARGALCHFCDPQSSRMTLLMTFLRPATISDSLTRWTHPKIPPPRRRRDGGPRTPCAAPAERRQDVTLPPLLPRASYEGVNVLKPQLPTLHTLQEAGAPSQREIEHATGKVFVATLTHAAALAAWLALQPAARRPGCSCTSKPDAISAVAAATSRWTTSRRACLNPDLASPSRTLCRVRRKAAALLRGGRGPGPSPRPQGQRGKR